MFPTCFAVWGPNVDNDGNQHPAGVLKRNYINAWTAVMSAVVYLNSNMEQTEFLIK